MNFLKYWEYSNYALLAIMVVWIISLLLFFVIEVFGKAGVPQFAIFAFETLLLGLLFINSLVVNTIAIFRHVHTLGSIAIVVASTAIVLCASLKIFSVVTRGLGSYH